MEPCLIDNKICSENHLRCEVCSLNDCKEAIRMYETYEQRIEKIKKENIRKALPAQCRKCSFLQFISVQNKKLYCPYMIKECLIK